MTSLAALARMHVGVDATLGDSKACAASRSTRVGRRNEHAQRKVHRGSDRSEPRRTCRIPKTQEHCGPPTSTSSRTSECKRSDHPLRESDQPRLPVPEKEPDAEGFVRPPALAISTCEEEEEVIEPSTLTPTSNALTDAALLKSQLLLAEMMELGLDGDSSPSQPPKRMQSADDVAQLPASLLRAVNQEWKRLNDDELCPSEASTRSLPSSPSSSGCGSLAPPSWTSMSESEAECVAAEPKLMRDASTQTAPPSTERGTCQQSVGVTPCCLRPQPSPRVMVTSPVPQNHMVWMGRRCSLRQVDMCPRAPQPQ
eukprot:TRINITY_DN866_c0_g1_i4.p1 TRINITY_DN866_c0_g1~~TRINITY_DN866_c0_g1_i4.p1  ORF type:complete len:312 (-),score=33.04 TRINITY_DN866_c0_g1_i4:443-1378(-)